jgi:transposase
MQLYAGIDLHSNNSFVVVSQADEKVVYQKRLPNSLDHIIGELEPYKEKMTGIVVESTYNWYWLVDGLEAAGYKVFLANTTAIQQYSGLKHTNDKTDARWLAKLLQLNILPTGHIYPKEERGVRDLLRKRGKLVQQRTSQLLSLQSLIERHTSVKLDGNEIKKLTVESLKEYLLDEAVYIAGKSNLLVMECIDEQINLAEKSVLKRIKLKGAYKKLLKIDGIGKILALTIMLETGDLNRFSKVGNYASYCRCVGSKKESNGKKKGENNRKNGNRYLSWAYVEAANFAIRFNPTIKKYYQRKKAKTNAIIAIKTIAHKLARACFYVLKDGVDFDVNLSFG